MWYRPPEAPPRSAAGGAPSRMSWGKRWKTWARPRFTGGHPQLWSRLPQMLERPLPPWDIGYTSLLLLLFSQYAPHPKAWDTKRSQHGLSRCFYENTHHLPQCPLALGWILEDRKAQELIRAARQGPAQNLQKLNLLRVKTMYGQAVLNCRLGEMQ